MTKRESPGSTGKGKFYHIEIRPKSHFTLFRIQDVGRKGGLERLAGKRPSGSWGTVSWLISKDDAHSEHGRLIIDDKKAKSALKQIRGPIVHVKGDIFKAHPVRNIPEREKPTPAMRLAQKTNIKNTKRTLTKKLYYERLYNKYRKGFPRKRILS